MASVMAFTSTDVPRASVGVCVGEGLADELGKGRSGMRAGDGLGCSSWVLGNRVRPAAGRGGGG